jgi:hypothetical protein
MSPTELLGETWTDLRARLDADATLRRWAEREPALHEFADAQAIAEVVHHGRDHAHTDELFIALLRLAATDNGNDRDAALLIAHLMHNASRAIALSLRDMSPDIDVLVASALWTQIRTYRWQHRRRGHPCGLTHDTRAAVLRELSPYRARDGRICQVEVAPHSLELLLDATCEAEQHSVEPDPRTELHAVLEWARSSGVLSDADVELLLDFELATLDRRAALAASHGLHEQSLRRRCRHAKARLRDARWAYLAAAAA